MAASNCIQFPCNCSCFLTPVRIGRIAYINALTFISEKFSMISPITGTEVSVGHPIRHEFTYTIFCTCKIVCTLSRCLVICIKTEKIIFGHTDTACPPGAFIYCNPERKKCIYTVLILVLNKKSARIQEL